MPTAYRIQPETRVANMKKKKNDFRNSIDPDKMAHDMVIALWYSLDKTFFEIL